MKKSKAIGVIVEDITVFCSPEIIDGITKCCEEFGYHILLTNIRMYKKFSDTYYVNEDFEQIVDKEINELLSKQVDGIIYVTAYERKLKYFSDNLKIPAIIAYGYSKNKFIPSVVVDDKSRAYLAIKHLIDNGYKNIGSNISVVGFDNRELSVYYHPSFTTVALPLFEIGYTACKNIINTLGNPDNIYVQYFKNSPFDVLKDIEDGIAGLDFHVSSSYPSINNMFTTVTLDDIFENGKNCS